MPRRTRIPVRTWKSVGRLQRSSPRFAFVDTGQDEGDVYVASRNLAGALDGDEVEIQVRRNRRSGLLEGRVLRIVRRPFRQLTGRVSGTGGGCVLLPDDPRFPSPILIADARKGSFLEGDRVVAVLEGRQRGELNRCRVTEVLGDADDARLDSTLIAREFGLPLSFGNRAEEEAELAVDSDSGARARLEDASVFTIDPETAADFDDALSVREVSRDRFEVGVHIADVSAFVSDGSAVDLEAMERGNSVYLPDRVFPMLPPKISSELCSLKPGEPRGCVSILMELTRDGDVLRSRILESTIRSERRFTYEEVQRILDGEAAAPRGLQRDLRTLSALSRALNEKRRQRKSLDFELPELKVRLSDLGLPEELYLEEKVASHSLVEEMMILANTLIGSAAKRKRVPFLFRVHPKAKSEKLKEFFRAAAAMGLPELGRSKADARELAVGLGESLDPARQRLLNSLLVRSMEKARYDVTDIGHYGLALEGYCHFTSPIRRYADLLNHRIVKHCLVRRAKAPPREAVGKLPAAAELCTQTEIRADEAEREANRVKGLRFMEQFLGEVFEGLIVGVINSGFFVEISGHLVEGMVSRDVLRDDSYHYDEEHFSLVGKRRGRRYSLGQSLAVQVAKVDPLGRMMDLVPVPEPGSRRGSRQRKERRWR
ncbi:MAG: VacB/RNase II family 3'-5' exoribonuclease [Candidatus Eiseniibacteriota bacterium]|nr:MAG: VacB/RNase II family 3'-5' exoribonuclease [Candidatus Eisenbacteria bacterium]